jgi:hypothetical protein
MKISLLTQNLLLLPFAVLGYVPRQGYPGRRYVPANQKLAVDVIIRNSNDIGNNVDEVPEDDDAPKLVLSVSEVHAQMSKFQTKYPTAEADYLSAARARNSAKQASSERTATDADWRQIAAEKKQAVGEIDDWDNSLSEAGNVDSQILIPLASNIGEDGEDEPKLMLF